MHIGSRKVLVEGVVYKNKKEACDHYGIDYQEMRKVLRRGRSLDEALGITEPTPLIDPFKDRWAHKEGVWEKERDEGARICSTCGVKKPLDMFCSSKYNPLGRSNYCKMCKTESSRIRRYGVDNERYSKILEEQGGRCAICKTDNPKTRGATSFAVDHCHTTGKVRGLLCTECNVGIGKFKDNVEILKEAIAYLKK